MAASRKRQSRGAMRETVRSDWAGTCLPHLVGMALVLLVLLSSGNDPVSDHLFIKACYLEVLSVLSLGAYLLFSGRAPRLPSDWLARLLIVLGVWGLVSLAWTPELGFGVASWFRWLAAAALFTMAFQIHTRDARILVFRYAFVALVLLAALGCIQYLFEVDVVSQARGPAATFANRNMAAQVVVMLWPLTLILVYCDSVPTSPRQYVYCLGIALAFAFIVYTGTRAAGISILVQLLVLAVVALASRLQGHDWSRGKVGAAPTVVAIALFVVMSNVGPSGFDPVNAYGDRWSEVADIVDKVEGPATYDRFSIWQSTAQMIADYPLVGVGLGGFDAVFPEYAVGSMTNVQRAHNDYLQAFAELGVTGILLSLSVVVLLVWRGFRLFFSIKAEADFVSLSLLLPLGGLAVTAIFSFPLQIIGPCVVGGIVLGLVFDQSKSFAIVRSRYACATSVLIVGLIVAVINADWRIAFGRYNQEVINNTWVRPASLDVWLEHPMFRRFIRTLSQQLQSSQPAKAEMVARTVTDIRKDDVILNNTLAISLIYQGKYLEADEIIKATRAIEPKGYYRSYENEFISAALQGNREAERRLVAELEEEPRDLLLAEPRTLRGMAVAAFNYMDFESARAYALENLSIYPIDDKSLQVLIASNLRLGKLDEARDQLERYTLNGGDEAFMARVRRELNRRFVGRDGEI